MSEIYYQGDHSITIGSKNTWKHWHLVPSSRPVVTMPDVKTKYVEMPGINGVKDMTTSLTGYVMYGVRQGSWEFIVANGYWNWQEAYTTIAEYLHGKNRKVVLDDDPGHYYEGRLNVNEWKSSKDFSTIVIDYQLNPYKKETFAGNEDWEWDPFNFDTGVIREYANLTVKGSLTVTIPDVYQRVSPTINVSSSMSMQHTNPSDKVTVYQLAKGDNSIPEFVLLAGTNKLKFTGNGKVTIKYRGGRL